MLVLQMPFLIPASYPILNYFDINDQQFLATLFLFSLIFVYTELVHLSVLMDILFEKHYQTLLGLTIASKMHETILNQNLKCLEISNLYLKTYIERVQDFGQYIIIQKYCITIY